MRIKSAVYIYITLLIGSLWIIGFGVFVLSAFSFRHQTTEESPQAIVVLTGGQDRIATALNEMKKNQDASLLISGMYRNKKSQFLQKIAPSVANRITLGYSATNTEENALETEKWLDTTNTRELLLITSFYHMPRALLHVKHYLPASVKIIPLAVYPKTFSAPKEWIKTRYAWLLFLEYHKYMLTRLDYLVKGKFV